MRLRANLGGDTRAPLVAGRLGSVALVQLEFLRNLAAEPGGGKGEGFGSVRQAINGRIAAW